MDLVILINADAVAAKGGVLNGKSTDLDVHAVFIAIPNQPCKRTSFGGKEKGGVFARSRRRGPPSSPRAIVVAAAVAAAAAADIASEAGHQPPDAPSVAATGAAPTVDVDAMSKPDQRTLLAKLTLAMNH